MNEENEAQGGKLLVRHHADTKQAELGHDMTTTAAAN